jgi:hypothetical protein
MQFMLEKNFDGRHFWVKSGSVQIDSMFFPATSEKVYLKSELDIEKTKPSYVNHPTVLFCNPNALFYHHMVNQPNAFWLNFFLKKGVNVMAWNYRGYGNTKGTPTPYNIKTDGEKLISFMLNDLEL